jgi:putative hydrolase of the HAD superfamily
MGPAAPGATLDREREPMPDPMLPKGLLCDMDDTILNSSGAREQCWREAFAAEAARPGGLEWTGFIEAVTRQERWFWTDPERHRRGRMNLLAACRETTHGALVGLGFDLPDLAAALADRYRDLRESRCRVFPGALEALAHLRARGVRLAMMTNGTAADQRRKIDRFGLDRYFDRILIEGELGVGKPHPDVYTSALAALRCAPTEAWSIGDNLEWDVVGPQRLGVYGIWVDGRGSGLPADSAARPDRIVRSISELRQPTPSTGEVRDEYG